MPSTEKTCYLCRDGKQPCFPLDLIKTVVCAWEHTAKSADECGSEFILYT